MDTDFYLSTDYPNDKVMGTFNGSFISAARYATFQPRLSQKVEIHSFGSWGLVIGAYSFNNSVWYPLGVPIADTSTAIPAFQTVEVSAYCTDTTMVIQSSNYTSSAETIYYAIQVVSRD